MEEKVKLNGWVGVGVLRRGLELGVEIGQVDSDVKRIDNVSKRLNITATITICTRK